MSNETKIQLDKRFTKKLQARYEQFNMEVGVLNDGPHKSAAPAKRGLGSFAGGPVRKATRGGNTSVSISEVSEANRERMGVNYLTDPFKSKKNSDIVKFTTAFFKMASGKADSMRKRCENLMQAVVRNPILRGDYGQNSEKARAIKTFDRLMIDTAQLFKAIRASVKTGGRRG